jgi:hypothetical protein
MIETLYLGVTVLLVLAGLALVALAVSAYVETQSRSMLLLALGFTLVVAATVATSVSTVSLGYQDSVSLLFVNSSLTLVGYAFVIGSLFSYR